MRTVGQSFKQKKVKHKRTRFWQLKECAYYTTLTHTEAFRPRQDKTTNQTEKYTQMLKRTIRLLVSSYYSISDSEGLSVRQPPSQSASQPASQSVI